MSTAASSARLRYSCDPEPMPGWLRVRTLLVCGLAAACLIGGYALGLRDAAGTGLLRPPAPAQLSVADQRAFGVVWETLTELERDYYRRDQLNAETLASAAARGMVAAV